MIEQLKTIREFFDGISVPYETLIAFEQLEAMVGVQEPVAYAIFAENGNIRIWSTESQHVKRIAQEKGLSLVTLYAAPVAQQPQEIEVQCPVCNHKFYEWPNDKQPQAEAVPPDVEVIRKALERAFIMGQNYWADADSESYSANKRSDVTRQKFNAMRDEVCAAIAQQKGQP